MVDYAFVKVIQVQISVTHSIVGRSLACFVDRSGIVDME